MATYYVDPVNGNNAWDGTSPTFVAALVGPKQTLSAAEAIPVAANDTVWARPGVYRETLTCGVSGAAGQPITYIGDVMGEIWGVGGIVRVTGSDNDQTAVRANCVTCGAQRDYRTFRGFAFDTSSSYTFSTGLNLAGTNWIVEDCWFENGATNIDCLAVLGANQADWIIRRCIFRLSAYWASANGIHFYHGSDVSDAGHIVQNCLFMSYVGVSISNVGGIDIDNITCLHNTVGVYLRAVPAAGQVINVHNSSFSHGFYGLNSVGAGYITEDHNNFWGIQIARLNVAVGANSTAYLDLHEMPLLYDGLRLPWDYGHLSEWSVLSEATDSGSGATDDMHGIPRPVTNGKRSWGAYQFKPQERDTTTTYDASDASIALPDAGVVQYRIATTNVQMTITVQVYREANYAGVAPQMIVKQPGVADDTTTDAGAAGAWNELTTTLTPAAYPGFVQVELRSNNTAAAGNYAVYFDELAPTPSRVLGDFDQWISNRETVGDAVQAEGGGGAARGFIIHG